jgi:hypothetical protein
MLCLAVMEADMNYGRRQTKLRNFVLDASEVQRFVTCSRAMAVQRVFDFDQEKIVSITSRLDLMPCPTER